MTKSLYPPRVFRDTPHARKTFRAATAFKFRICEGIIALFELGARAEEACPCVIAGTTAKYATIILKKGGTPRGRFDDERLLLRSSINPATLPACPLPWKLSESVAA